MEISFGTSKNGEVTCSIDNISLHSRYNPQEEANKFVNNLITDFEPSNIIITGPCLPYLVNPLKAKFTKSKIIAIQYSSDFEKYNNSWDKVFTIEKNTSILDFQEILFLYNVKLLHMHNIFYYNFLMIVMVLQFLLFP